MNRVVVLSFWCLSIALAPKAQYASADYVRALKSATDVMLNDVASPVAASRYYAYITLAAYETACLYDTNLKSFSGVLKGFPALRVASDGLGNADPDWAVLLTLYKAAQKMLPSGFMLKRHIDSLAKTYASTEEQQYRFRSSAAVADQVVAQVVAYAGVDGFRRLNNLPRYTPRQGKPYWQPTAPAFMAPVEPHWNTLRTFLLDSANQFKPAKPVVFNLQKGSAFHRLMQEVYEVGKKATKEQQDIANFWDCNPFAVQQIGHVEFGLKKISPGGHWVGIAGIAAIQAHFSLKQTALAHAILAIALADGFIACWDEKYRSNRVRPETVIQQELDPSWRPLLQTPPFPEYVSGHSVASHTAAILLSQIFGENVGFLDNTEVEFGLPERRFQSFRQAAAEAAISRLYGGIHFRDAITAGEWQGQQVGQEVSKRLAAHLAHFK
jgi:PAP2 superfamily